MTRGIVSHGNDSGHPLEPEVRARLERALGQTSVVSASIATRTATIWPVGWTRTRWPPGRYIYLADGAGDPGSRAGLWLLAHEAAHVVQQTRLRPQRWHKGGVPIRCDTATLEQDADRVADLVVAGGRAATTLPRVTPDPSAPPVLVQRHASWEHRLLGDQPTSDLISSRSRRSGERSRS